MIPIGNHFEIYFRVFNPVPAQVPVGGAPTSLAFQTKRRQARRDGSSSCPPALPGMHGPASVGWGARGHKVLEQIPFGHHMLGIATQLLPSGYAISPVPVAAAASPCNADGIDDAGTSEIPSE